MNNIIAMITPNAKLETAIPSCTSPWKRCPQETGSSLNGLKYPWGIIKPTVTNNPIKGSCESKIISNSLLSFIMSIIDITVKEGRIQHVNHIQDAAYSDLVSMAEESIGRSVECACKSKNRFHPHFLAYPRGNHICRKNRSQQISWVPIIRITIRTKSEINPANQHPSASIYRQSNLVS